MSPMPIASSITAARMTTRALFKGVLLWLTGRQREVGCSQGRYNPTFPMTDDADRIRQQRRRVQAGVNFGCFTVENSGAART
jgi:hypothetical protein